MSDNDGSRIDAGRLFQTRGPLTANDRSPNIILVGGTSSFIMSDDDLRPACVCLKCEMEAFRLEDEYQENESNVWLQLEVRKVIDLVV